MVPSEIILQNHEGKRIKITVEIADKKNARRQGFMGRENIPTGTGMLFIWPHKKIISMWMKDTPHPLDVLFIEGDKIVKITSNTTPFSEALIYADKPINKVLELPAGDVDRFQIKVGWQVLF